MFVQNPPLSFQDYPLRKHRNFGKLIYLVRRSIKARLFISEGNLNTPVLFFILLRHCTLQTAGRHEKDSAEKKNKENILTFWFSSASSLFLLWNSLRYLGLKNMAQCKKDALLNSVIKITVVMLNQLLILFSRFKKMKRDKVPVL